MKKHLVSFILTVILLTAVLVLPVSALQPGDPIGDVLYTNVVAYIDGYPIRSYNIAGNTYIVAEDLLEYGFNVEWNGAESKLIIHENRLATPDKYTTTFTPTANTGEPGMPAMKYLYTEITTWIGSKQITGYNIGGYTCIFMDDLAAVFAAEGGYIWNPTDSTLRMTSKSAAAPVQPDPTPEIPTEITGYEGFEMVPDLGALAGLVPSMVPYADETSLTTIYSGQEIALASDLFGGTEELLTAYVKLLSDNGFVMFDLYADAECAVLYFANVAEGVGVAFGVYDVFDGYVSVECVKLQP